MIEEEQQSSTADGTCVNPFELFPDGDSQTLPSTASAMKGSCGGEGAEVVYEFTLTEKSGVNIQVGGADVVIYLLKDSCDVAYEVDGACQDNPQDSSAVEELNIGSLEAGTYYLVVDTWAPEVQGAYTVQWTVVPGGFCANDVYESNNEAGAALTLGTADFDTAALYNGEGQPTVSVDFELCVDDVDFFSFGHMGGNVSVAYTVVEDTGSISAEVLKLVIEGDEENGYTVVEGEKVGNLPYTGDLARGNYLIKFTATLTDATNGPNYTVAVEHDCEADDIDNVDETLDDANLANNQFFISNTLNTPIVRTICGPDIDTFVLQNVVSGNVTATLTGGASLTATVQRIGTNDSLSAVTTNNNVVGNDLVVTIPNATPGDYLVTVLATGVSMTTVYGVNAAFSGVSDGPSNDFCSGAENLALSSNATTVTGHTLNATDDVDGPTYEVDDGEGGTMLYSCNNEIQADEDMATAAASGEEGLGTPGDVFYHVTLPTTADFEFEFDGSESEFTAAIYMLEFDGTCPSDLSTLNYVKMDSETDLCAVGTSRRVRLDDLAAGDYLLVVDGYYLSGYPEWDIPGELTAGAFELTVRNFAGGFPAIASCENATTTALPTSGSSVSFTVNAEEGDSYIDSYADCGDYADNALGGKEQIFILEPTSNLTLTVEASGDYDTVVEIREANTTEEGDFQCENGTQVLCNDDNPDVPNLGSLLEDVDLTSGKTYYLVVDAFNSSGTGEVTVTLTAE